MAFGSLEFRLRLSRFGERLLLCILCHLGQSLFAGQEAQIKHSKQEPQQGQRSKRKTAKQSPEPQGKLPKNEKGEEQKEPTKTNSKTPHAISLPQVI